MSYCDTVLEMSDANIRALPPAVWHDLRRHVADEVAEARATGTRTKGQEALEKLERGVGVNPDAEL